MKKIYYITAVFATLFLVGCGDGIDLPGVNVETDLNKIPLPDNNVNLEQVELKPSTEPMLHEVSFRRRRQILILRNGLNVEFPVMKII